MAIQLGIENKKQVYQLLGLAAAVVLLLAYNLLGSGSSKKNTLPPPTAPVVGAKPTGTVNSGTANPAAIPVSSNASAAQKITGLNIDPALHLDKLAESESIFYAGTGRNIFSANSVPIPTKIEQALASARASAAAAPPPVPSIPEPPRAPPIDLKYFGFTQNRDRILRAFFTHGDDIFIAHNGEIIDHRYKVESIQADSVRVTDMSYNNTQSISLSVR